MIDTSRSGTVQRGAGWRVSWWTGPHERGGRPGSGAAIDERLRNALWLVVCCLLLAAMAFVTRPGHIIADTKIDMAVDPLGFLQRAVHLWDPAQFGQLQNQAVGYFFPMGPFFLAGKLLALPAWVVQRCWLTAVFIAAFLGTVRLASRLGIGTPATRIAAGLGYALAPRGLSLMGINSGEFLPAAMLPWVLIPLVRLLREGSQLSRRQRLRAAAQSAVAVALCSGMNAASVVAVLTLAVVYIFTGQRSWPRWRVLAWWAPAVGLATSWWLIPLLLLGKYGVSILPYSESAAVTTSVTSLANTLRGTEDWTTYLAVNGMPWWPVGFHLSTATLPTLLTGLIAALGLGGLAIRRMPERRFLLCVLLIGTFIILTGYVSGLGNPLAGSLDHLINGPLAPLRNLRKFDPMIRLPIVLGLAHLLASLRFHRIRVAAGVLAAVALAGTAMPAAANGLSAAGDFQAVPSYWVAATNWLNKHAGNQAVLAVPGARFGEYVWGRPMDDVLEAMFSGDWASTQLAAIGSVGNTRLIDAIEQRIEAGQGSAGLTQVLARMGVKYIVVRDDLIRSDLYGAWPGRVNDALYASPGMVKVAQFGTFPVGSSEPDNAVSNFDSPYPPVEVFRVLGAQPTASVVPAAGTMRVYGGPEALLTLADQGLLRGQPVVLNAAAARLAVGKYVITDSLRRIVRNFGEIRVDYSPTLTASDPASTLEAATDYLDPSWLPYAAVAQYQGIANVTASSSAADISALPSQSATGLLPFAAVDGNPKTMWESGGVTGPVHQWLRVDFTRPVDPGTIQVAFADRAAVGPPVTKVDVQTAAGTATENVRQAARAQPLAVPHGLTRWLRITIEAVAPTPFPLAGTQAGIAELTVPGVTASRAIVAPTVPVPAGTEPSVLLAKAEPAPSGCMLTSLRWVCSQSLIRPTEEQYGFYQAFTAATAHGADLSGLAVLTSQRVIARYAWPGAAQPRVTASSAYTTDPADMPGSAFDDNLSTAWISGPGDAHPVLTIRWRGTRKIRQVKVVRPTAADGPLRVLVTGSSGQLRGGVIGRSGLLTFQPPLRTSMLSFAFTPDQLPVQISEVRIPGVTPLTPPASGPIVLSCGQGPTIVLNGVPVPTRAAGSEADLLQGRPMHFSACGPATVRGGRNSVAEPAADPTGFDVQSVLVDPAGAAGLTAGAAVRSAPAAPISWGPASRSVRVAASQRSFLVVDENFNAGWRATIGGRILAPVQLDGWKQGWLLPAGTSGVVTLTYLPDATYRVALFGGLVLLALMIVVALPLRRRRTTRSAPAAGPVDPGPVDAPVAGAGVRSRRAALARVPAGLAVVALGLWTGGYPGAVILPAATLLFMIARRRRAAGRAWHLAASGWLVCWLMLAAAIGQAAGYQLEQWGHAGGLVTVLWDTGPQLICLLILARLIAGLAVARPAADGRPAASERVASGPGLADASGAAGDAPG